MSPWTEAFLTLLTRKPLGLIGFVLLSGMVLAAILADVVAPYDPTQQHMADRLVPPSATYLLGTDQFGRDLLSRILHGARTSLYVGMGVVIIGTSLATVLGAVSAYVGGKFDLVFQRVVDAFQAIPQLVLILTIVSVIGPGLFNIIMALAFRQAMSQSRVARGAVMAIRQNVYMDAALAIGASHLRILLVYVLPNIMAPTIIVASLALGQAILAEATLSFLGFGVPPPNPTWGGMLSDEARRFMLQAPWMAIVPGVALSLAVFGINMLGDALRDVLDPRLRGSH